MHKLLQMQQPSQHLLPAQHTRDETTKDDSELLLFDFAQHTCKACCTSSKFIAFQSDNILRLRMQWAFKQVACFVLNTYCQEEVRAT
jgi:hypothetical protein